MFSIVKIREGLEANDYRDPGWYKHPEGTIAHEWNGDAGKAAEAPAVTPTRPAEVELRVLKPTGPMKR